MSNESQATLPVDWKIQQLAELGVPVRGGSPRPAGDPRFFNGSYIPWLTVASLTGIPDSQLTVNETATHLTQEGALRSRTLTPGTLIIANSGATLGIAKVLGIQCCANDGIAALLNPLPDIDVRYLAYFINTQTKLLRDVVATGNGQPNLNTGLIGAINIPVPASIIEQRKIANSLTDVDDLIRGFDQLIAKKRDIQQAAMQQLLTGQRRLPGFSGEWEVKRFGEVVVCRSERVDPRSAGRQEFCVELEHIEARTGRLIGQTVADESSSLKTVFKRKDVLFGKLRAYQRKYWLAERGGVCSTEIWALSCDANFLLPEFLYHTVKTDAFIEVASTAYGTHMPRSDWKVVAQFEVSLPTCEEQAAIASILSDMDTEIATLETRRKKALQLKQGMMQELLTGRIRMI
ncbi:TPA: restriction endonuclease subunit S [Pseudomonas aeruginosa]|uniref:restriction endonuclease subunit S n=1 Tax=Pseudomonas aeruginosa TaxID=287 RepID=UPI001CBF37DF|nr:restriction endonuclease subunit S [Pseudomonas aeruginosa]HBO2993408.1 restriction endonuclease subunit S [Pseudomonas aeruginosa]HBO5656560.1 restriction endonuclease subunit S [Pseudomonas aeruginosa]HCI1863523.1 restriction endonuclease subunit S [Pseudomonas aeruginosa]HCI2647549.1 restriction endonuclease subunit S [Pseudomonas aeruginosa]